MLEFPSLGNLISKLPMRPLLIFHGGWGDGVAEMQARPRPADDMETPVDVDIGAIGV